MIAIREAWKEFKLPAYIAVCNPILFGEARIELDALYTKIG